MPYCIADDGVRLHYSRAGCGTPVVLIHGLTASAHFFRKPRPAWSKHFQAITPDLRGQDQSKTPCDQLTRSHLAEDLKSFLPSLTCPGSPSSDGLHSHAAAHTLRPDC